MSIGWVLLILAAVIIGYIWMMYNGLVTMRMRINEAMSQIDVQLKRRTDLIPNLVETVKGYAKHEKSVFSEVTKARSALMGAKNLPDKAQAHSDLSNALGRLFAVAENYPQLKANENFLQLQKELSDTEDKIAYSRQYYNSTVMDYNTRLQTFPNNMMASGMGFAAREFFGASEEDKKPVKVKFD